MPPRPRRPATLVGPKPLSEEPPASRAPGHFLPELRSPHRVSALWMDDPAASAACLELATLVRETKTLHSYQPRFCYPAKAGSRHCKHCLISMRYSFFDQS